MRTNIHPILQQRVLCTVLCIGVFIGSLHASVTMNWATVGNPGNVADSATSFGMVTTIYRIATEEVTNAQYAEFLNMVDADGINPNGIYNSSMGSDVRGGISFNLGNPNGSKYAAKINMGNKPVNYVSWFDAARFANWMNNGQRGGSTENGAYDMTVATPVRLVGANVFLPTEDEWYKAAYHDPLNPGADASGNIDYWLYPTRSDTIPTVGSATPIGNISNPGTNVANYVSGADWNGQDGNVTTVGSATSTSFYGAFDMAGNVYEWNETIVSADRRGLRGGSWFLNSVGLQSTDRGSFSPLAEGFRFGFRVASIPEPTTCSLILIFLVTFGCRRSRECQ